ncbi:insulin-like receptor isoform X1 [Spodoptera litura]|uniref:Tyrosine-protein kinase receptor n=1 Tax=Spodoptera litura TaxID=69820 RepID=A0A9J7ISZ4_SPOLT|nr:insulin-like receptor isoform X1 [Spodoptera litura]
MRRACDNLAWPVVACALLMACARADAAGDNKLPTGICSSMDIRNKPESFAQLKGCRVIEGTLSMVLMERATPKIFENMSFPELREVTDYIVMYRTKGVQNLGDLFPNLTVIRGMQLFKDFALVIFDNEHLESVGLRSLVKIERGGVRIQQNDRLCYANTIDWSLITSEHAVNIIRLNYDTRLCGLCPYAQSRVDGDHRQSHAQCPTDGSGRLLCWDDKHCQKVCPKKCGDSGCLNNGTCCHASCLGGCTGPTSWDCHACRNFSIGDGPERKCVEKCPSDLYELFHRCVTESACRATKPPTNAEADHRGASPHIRKYKIFNNSCVFTCRSGYMEVGDANNLTCQQCPASGCVKECAGGKIDSVAAAEQFQGCTHIKGKLEINIRASGGNTLAVLENSLGDIREITGMLQVVRAFPLVSLMFLKKLRKITGSWEPGAKNRGQVIHIFNNPNLELLWDWPSHGPIDIVGGSLFIHLNPKLCYINILPLKNMTREPRSNFTEIEVSEDNNGNQASCLPDKLHVKASQLYDKAVVLSWNMYCPEDMRKLLGYSIYYIATDLNVTLYEQRDVCSDRWNVLDITADEARNYTRDAPAGNQNQNEILLNPCQNRQPLFCPVSHLTPFTRYAAYVKTYTTTQEKKGAQSSIIYFVTLPERPSPPVALSVEMVSPHSVFISWSPPTMPNGTIILYHVEVQANSYNKPKILAGNTNYCSNPSLLTNMITAQSEEPAETQEQKTTGDVTNGSCACKEEDKPGTRFNSRIEEDRRETIAFENQLQNTVYVKNDNRPKAKRVKRSVDHTLNSMLVKLTKNFEPQVGLNYTNSTDEEANCSRIEPNACVVKDSTGYVKSLYFELGGKVQTLKVTNMRHFTWYTVSIWACRSRHENESVADYNDKWCSNRSYNTFRTPERVNADIVDNLQAEVIISNKTLGEVNVTWKPPKNPNGFVVAYSVYYTRVDESTSLTPSGLQGCVTADEYEKNGHSYTLRSLAPGNYTIEVTPITVAGSGNTSAVHPPIFIPERSAESAYEWVWGVVGGCVMMGALLGAGLWYARRALLPSAEANKLFASVNPEYVSTMYVPDEWEVPRASVEFIRELGQGSFGMVYEGLAKGIEKGKAETRCAVKTVNEHATDRERQEFLNEASVMKAFDTFHVVRLLGVVSRGQPTLVIMELMEFGDLKTYLRSHRPDADASLPRKGGSDPPTLENILQMAIEIADGMAYLSAKKFVHRDLAARNCMVAGDLTVKVGDFGMTRDIYETDYYRKGTKGLLPVRWMSPESLKDGVFSSSSDVWSYGVVLWEMATLAMQPYQGLSNEQVVRYVVEGGVMERPEHCPDRLYELMRACWAHRAPTRPSFLQLVADLAPSAHAHFRQRSFFHTPQGQEMYSLQRTTMEDEAELAEVNVGAVATGSGSNLFGVSGRLASWVRELSSLRSRASEDAAAEPLQPLRADPKGNGGPLPPC